MTGLPVAASGARLPAARHTDRAELGRGFLALAGLSSLALTQPIYDLLRRTPEFFAIRELGLTEVGAVAALLAVGPAVALCTPALGALFFRPALLRPAIAAVVGPLVGVIALQTSRSLHLSAGVAVTVLATVAASWCYARYRAARSLALLLSVAIVVAPAVLLLDRDVRRALYRADPGSTIEGTIEGAGALAPIVLVVFDEWSAVSLLDADGAIDRRRLPNLARLAEQATWYPDALAASNMTHHAVPAILTGARPDRDQLPIVADHPVNLFTLLAPSHQLYAMEPVTSLCPPSLNRLTVVSERPPFSERFGLLVADLAIVWLRLTLPPQWAEDLPSVNRAWSGFARGDDEAADAATGDLELARAHPHRRNDERVNDFRRFIDAIGSPGSRPDLYFAHVLLPHAPWEYLPSGRRYDRSREYGLHDGTWTADAWVVRNHQKRYLMQVQFVDRLIGELLDRLEEVGLFDRSLIAITADHGLSFVPGSPLRLPVPAPRGQAWDLAAVPLIVKAPFQEQGDIDHSQVPLVELLPRILALAGANSWSPLRRPEGGTEPVWFNSQQAEIRLSPDRDAWHHARLQEQAKLFGSSNDALSIGVLPQLHGRRLDEVRIEDGPVQARIDNPDDWRDVDLDAARLPAVLEATFVDPDAPVDRGVVVALNGVIGDTTYPYTDRGGRLRVYATLPDELLRFGENRIELFLASVREDSVGLERIAPPRVYSYLADRAHRYSVVRNSAGLIGSLERRRRDSATPPTSLLLGPGSRELSGHLTATIAFPSPGTGGRRRFRLVGRVFDADNPGRPNTIVTLLGARTTAGFTGAGSRDYGFSLEVLADPKQVAREGFVAFVVSHRGQATRLRFKYGALERGADGGEILPVSDGRRLPIVATGGRYQGAVDHLVPVGGTTRVRGWAADLQAGESARQVVIYRDGRFRAVLGAARQERTDLTERFHDPALGRSGFRGTAPGGPLPSVFAERYRVFAIMAEGIAVELPVLLGD